MYKQIKTKKNLVLKNGSDVFVAASLKDEYGGESHIIVDDNCYVLVNGNKERGYSTVKHWYKESIQILKTLPDNPRDIIQKNYNI